MPHLDAATIGLAPITPFKAAGVVPQVTVSPIAAPVSAAGIPIPTTIPGAQVVCVPLAPPPPQVVCVPLGCPPGTVPVQVPAPAACPPGTVPVQAPFPTGVLPTGAVLPTGVTVGPGIPTLQVSPLGVRATVPTIFDP